jgi:hypothetical protein
LEEISASLERLGSGCHGRGDVNDFAVAEEKHTRAFAVAGLARYAAHQERLTEIGGKETGFETMRHAKPVLDRVRR